MSALVPLVTSAGPLLDRASAGVKALVNAVRRREEEYFEEGHFNAAQVKKELQDASEETKTRALKRLLAAHASGLDVSGLLPEVVKAIAVPSLELKRLVYLFLILHAEKSRDVALLSINSFQKDLADRNQVLRATSLKALASIRLLEVVQLLVAALRRAAADSSPLVRRTAAQCVMKIFILDPDQFQELHKIVLTLLKDIEISVVGAALVAFRELCMGRGAADCLRLYGDQLPLQQQQQQQQRDACFPKEQQIRSGLVQEEQRDEEEEERRLGLLRQQQEQGTGYSKIAGNDGWRPHARHQKRREGEQLCEEEEEKQENGVISRRIDAQRQRSEQRETDGRRINQDREAHQPASGNPYFLGGRHRESGRDFQSGAAATATMKRKMKTFRAQACALGLLHQHYRRLQESMLQLESFAQVVAIDIFLRYARVFFAEPAAAFNGEKEQGSQADKKQQQQQPNSSSSSSNLTPRGESIQVGEGGRGAYTDRYIQQCQIRGGSEVYGGYGGGEKNKTKKKELTYELFIAESPENQVPADLRLFLRNLGQLLYSESVAVVAAVATAFYYLLPPSAWKPIVHPLLRCIYTSPVEVREPLLHITAALAAAAPSLFLPHFRNFFVAFSDPPCVKHGKLLVLRRLLFCSQSGAAAAAAEGAAVAEGALTTLAPLLLQELCTYIRWPGDPLLMSTCFDFLVNIAVRFPSAQSSCMQIFIQLLDTAASCALASEAILALQVVLQQQQQQLQQQQEEEYLQQQQDEDGRVPRDTATAAVSAAAAAAGGGSSTEEWTTTKKGSSFRSSDAKKKNAGKGQKLGWLVLQLAMHLSRVIQGAAARASIVWIVGEYQREVGWVAADVFRQLTRSFAGEAEEVKLQILLLGLKVWAVHWDNKQLLHKQQQQQQQEQIQQQQTRFSSLHDEEETVSGGTARSETATRGAARDSERNTHERDACSSGSALLRNGVVVPHAPASPEEDVSDQQQQRFASASAAAHEREQQRQQQKSPQEKSEEQRYLLPPPTPEESEKAFPRLDKMFKYVCEAASFDMSYDVRDVARLYFALSRLALAGEALRKERESSPSSNSRCCQNSSSTSCSSGRSHDTSSTSASNSDRASMYNDISSSTEGHNAAAALAVTQEKNVLEGLAGCGGEMFKTSSAEAMADMSEFAQQYMRTLVATGSTGGRKTNMRLLQSRLKKTRASGAVAAAAAAQERSAHTNDECFDDIKREVGKHPRQPPPCRGYPNDSSSSSSRKNSRFVPEEDEPSLCCSGDEQNDREDSASHPSSSCLLLGSLSDLLGERMRGYIELPPFAATNSPDELRKVEQAAAPAGTVAECLMRGRAAGGGGVDKERRSGTLLSNQYYVDIQEVKAISSDDIIVKRSAAALMGRDTNPKADFTPLDLDSFYAGDLQSCGMPAGVGPGGLSMGHDSVTASSTASSTSSGAATVSSGAANVFASLLLQENNTFLPSSVAVRRAVAQQETGETQHKQQQQQQQSLWDLFGETHAHGGERMTQQLQQQPRNDDPGVSSQFEDKTVVRFAGAEDIAAAGSPGHLVTTDQIRGGREGGGVAVAGEDEESD